MHHGLTMNNLKYPRAKLLEKVEANRKAHNTTWKEARVEYAKQLEIELGGKLVDLRAGKEVDANSKLMRPVQFLADYDRAIAMLKMATDENIELDQQAFSQLVMDEWGWKSSFMTNTAVYGNAR
jgi:hypothetical protein